MSPNTVKSTIVGYDFTISCEKMPEIEVVKANLCEWFKKWVFQKEEGDGGFLHWQGRGSLIKPQRLMELASKCKDVFPGVHWSITSKDVHCGGSFNYVMKADTRIDGPWSDKEYEVPPPLTRQLKAFQERGLEYGWHKKVLELVQSYDERSIKVIVDPDGNSCKSLFCEYLEYMGLAFEVPAMRSMEDLMQCVMAIPAKKAYLIDMPRGMNKGKLGEFYSGLESIKNGVAYDKRYAFKKRRIDRPQVIVFTNTMPKMELLTKDRWVIYHMREDMFGKSIYTDAELRMRDLHEMSPEPEDYPRDQEEIPGL